MRHRDGVIVCITALLLAAASTSYGWYGKGHAAAVRATFAVLPKEVPPFFLRGVETVAHCSQDPDLFALRAVPEVRSQEAPEHYFDLELVKDVELPGTRYEFIALCARKGLDPSRVGLLPYGVTEWTERLTVAFAEYRKWPENPAIQVKCLVYAGLLAHYSQDLCQPLHTTIHFDGRANPDGTSPGTGIHAKVDALLEKLQVDPAKAAEGLKVQPVDPLLPGILGELRRSHALFERVYELEGQIPAADAPLAAGSEAAKFAVERLRESARFTASLFLTAWTQSEKIELPAWHSR